MDAGKAQNTGSSQKASLGGTATSLILSGRHHESASISEINVTPFVDVVLVLLIIFMITAPMLMRAMDVSLPAAELRNRDSSDRTIVSIDAQGRTYIDDTAINPTLLEERLKERVELQGLRLAYLRGDEKLEYKQIIAVMDLMKRAGIDTIGLVYVYPEEK